MRTGRRCRYLCVDLLGRYDVHDVGYFNVEGRRFLNASYVKSVPVAVIFCVARFGKIFDREFEKISLAAMNPFKALQLSCLFEIVDNDVGGQVVAVAFI